MSGILDSTSFWNNLQSNHYHFWALFALSLASVYVSGHIFSRRTDILIYCVAFACSLVWYFSLEARQDRDWNPEVAEQLTYQKQGNLVQLRNISNFN